MSMGSQIEQGFKGGLRREPVTCCREHSAALPVESELLQRPCIRAKEMKERKVSGRLQTPKTTKGRDTFHGVGTDESKNDKTKQQPRAMTQKDRAEGVQVMVHIGKYTNLHHQAQVGI